MANDNRPIIIKRIKKTGGAHHGGAWKVAYADFVTAMMAFFLLLWLLNAVTEEQKKGIAQYFRPTIAPQSSQAQPAILNGQPAVMSEVSGASAAEAQVDVENPDDDADQDPSGSGKDTGNAGDKNSQADQNSVPAPANTAGAKPVDVNEAQQVVEKAERQQFAEVKSKIEQQIQEDPGLADLKNNIDVQQTPDGLMIQLLDKDKVSMFPSGSADMNARSRELLQLVARVVAPLPNKLSIDGHTDATPFQGRPNYSNWELSTDRANAARRALVDAGVDDGRIENVSGKADTDPKIKADPYSPENRRISILLLRDKPALTGGSGGGASSPPAPAAPTPPEPADMPPLVPPATVPLATPALAPAQN